MDREMEKVRLYENRETFRTLQEYIVACCLRHAEKPCCLNACDGTIHSRTYGELQIALQSAGRFMAGLELPHRHVAILGNTDFEWMACYLGALLYGIVIIPLDKSQPEEQILSQLRFVDADLLLFDPEYSGVADAAQRCGICAVCLKQIEDSPFPSISLSETEGEAYALPDGTDGTDVAEIVFTSGTTGVQKAVMLTGENILYTVLFCIRLMNPEQGATIFSIFPNHHTYELVVGILAPLYFGMGIGVSDSMVHFRRNLLLYRPSYLLAVPALMSAIRREVLRQYRLRYGEVPDEDSLPDSHRKMLAEQLRHALGGRLTTLICGGAFLPADLEAFFEQLGIRVVQGYGITECSPVVSCNTDRDTWRLGVVNPWSQVQIQNGEICVRGKNVMWGYYKNPELTKKALRDGWFHTGDAGMMDAYGCLSLTGRIDRLIVRDNGENVSPEEIEGWLKNREEIENCRVYEDGHFLAAEIIPASRWKNDRNLEEIRACLSQVIRDMNSRMPKKKWVERFTIRGAEDGKPAAQKATWKDGGKEEN